ncbi:DegV family protein [Nocardioidaceae bacterium]|nr:DegV family protein [Nocardioidaceae bacterium]
MPGPLAVVTDSTTALSSEDVERHRVVVVPLQVVIGAETFAEGGDEVSQERVTRALRDFEPVSTSRPNPAEFVEAYEALAARGVSGILSVHLSGDMSGTVESARLAAAQVEVPVTVVDTRQVGAGASFAVLSACEAIEAGASLDEAAGIARRRGEATTSMFYVDTLEYLRKGGRIGHAQALVGLALAVKPLLRLTDGRVAPLEKVRTASRALGRLADLTVEAALESGEEHEVDVVVAHLDSRERAEGLARRLSDRLAEQLGGREIPVGEVGPVIGVHAGPGMVAVAVSPRSPRSPGAAGVD